MGSDVVVDITDADPRFAPRLPTEPGASVLSKCFQCGVCTASCPVREIEEGFSQRMILKLELL